MKRRLSSRLEVAIVHARDEGERLVAYNKGINLPEPPSTCQP